MTKILLLSDTHSYIDNRILNYAQDADEIWHAGDFGNLEVIQKLEKTKKLRGVYGNIDEQEIRKYFPLEANFEVEGLHVWMVHIGGYPKRYKKGIRSKLKSIGPDLFISGHSHILKVMRDQKLNLLHMNPGAAGNQGFHQMRTMIRFKIQAGKVIQPEVIELGKRGK